METLSCSNQLYTSVTATFIWRGGCQCQCLNTKKILSVSAFYIVCHKMFVASSAIAGQDLVICIYRRQVDLKFCGPYMCWCLGRIDRSPLRVLL